MWRGVSIAAASACVFSLSGCGSSGGDDPTDAPAGPTDAPDGPTVAPSPSGGGDDPVVNPVNGAEIIQCADQRDDVTGYNNIGYIFSGYNIFRGDPTGAGVGADPGFTNQPLFKTDFSDCGRTSDGRHFIPKGVNIVTDRGCSLSLSRQSYSSATRRARDVAHSFGVTASAEVPVEEGVTASAGFGASNSFRSSNSATQTQLQKFTESKAECSVYRMTMSSSLPETSNAFRDYISGLSSPDDNAWWRLFDQFGTHYLTDVKMGSRHGFQRTITECGFGAAASQSGSSTTSLSLGLEVADAGSLSMGASWSDSDHSANENSWHHAFAQENTITLGVPFNADDDLGTWQEASKKDPMPIKYDMEFLCEHPALADHRQPCTAALKTYCKYLQQQDSSIPCSADEEPAEPACLWNRDCHGYPHEVCQGTGADARCVEAPDPEIVIYQPDEHAGSYCCREVHMKKSTALSLHNGCWLADDWQCYNYGPAPLSQWDSSCYYPLTYGADFYVGRIELPEGVNVKLFSTDSSWGSLHSERCNARMAGNPQTIEGPTNGRSDSFWTYQTPRVGVFQFEPSGDGGSCRSPSSAMTEPRYRNVTMGELMIA